MNYNTKIISRGVLAFAAAIFISASLHARAGRAASMPQLTRLQPLTRNVAAPSSAAVDSEGVVYIVESSSNRLLASVSFDAYPKVYSGFFTPLSVAATNDGKVLVGNKEKGNVVIFDPSIRSVVGALGKGLNEFSRPTGIAVAEDGVIYVADMKASAVKSYAADGTFIGDIGEPGNADGQTASPIAVAVNKSSNEIVIVDQPLVSSSTGVHSGARIQIFDRKGVFVASFSGFGVGDDLLTRPIGAAVDSKGRIYVSDSYQNLIKIFSGDGQVLGVISPEVEPFRTPLGLGYCPKTNRLFVASLLSRRVEVYGIDDYTGVPYEPVAKAAGEPKTSSSVPADSSSSDLQDKPGATTADNQAAPGSDEVPQGVADLQGGEPSEATNPQAPLGSESNSADQPASAEQPASEDAGLDGASAPDNGAASDSSTSQCFIRALVQNGAF